MKDRVDLSDGIALPVDFFTIVASAPPGSCIRIHKPVELLRDRH